MATARPLRDVFADVTGDEAARASDPAEFLRSSGHEDLPDTLVAEAVTSYADTAPVEVAEHLSQYVMSNSAVPGIGADVDPSSWLEALAGAPELLESTVDPAAAGLDDEPRYEAGEATSDTGDATLDTDGDDAGFDLDFGLGRAVETVEDALGEAVDTVSDFFGAAPTAGPRESFGAADAPDAGDEAFGAAAGPGAGEGVFGAAGPDTGDGVFGASADLPADEDDADETPDAG
jgi:hypothetical protein